MGPPVTVVGQVALLPLIARFATSMAKPLAE
jgi:hypothetical protein